MYQFSTQLGSTGSREFSIDPWISDYAESDVTICGNANFLRHDMSTSIWSMVMFSYPCSISTESNRIIEYLSCQSSECRMTFGNLGSSELHSYLCDSYTDSWYGDCDMYEWTSFGYWIYASTMTRTIYQMMKLYSSSGSYAVL